MILEERPDGQGTGEESSRPQDDGSIRKGYGSFVQNQPGQLQSHRARLHQQISKELRMRTGAENLYSEGITIPMIPLGLKETKELDWATPLKRPVQKTQ